MSTDLNDRPQLFTAAGTTSLPNRPALIGGRCQDCKRTFFPMQPYGCEHCGSVHLEEFHISGRGRLITSAKVHLHANPARQAPFTVGSILTDDGAVVRVLLDPTCADGIAPGDAVVSMLVPETREGHGQHDLRFTKEV